MVKAYLRYVESSAWGVLVSSQGNVLTDKKGEAAIAPALDAVCFWSIKTGALLRTLRPASTSSSGGGATAIPAEVTSLALDPKGDELAVGYADGTVRLWQIGDSSERVALTGHRGAVISLRFSRDGAVLASGGNDTNVVLWDVVGETGICKLRGHRGAVNDVCLLKGTEYVASASKDGVLKLWDVQTQHCVQTAVVPSGELWSLDATQNEEQLLTGGAGGEIILWALERKPLVESSQSSADTSGADTKPNAGAASKANAVAATASVGSVASGAAVGGSKALAASWTALRATMQGTLESPSTAHVVTLRFSAEHNCVAVQFADKKLLLLSVQDSEQLKRQLKRRLAKKRKQVEKEADAEVDALMDKKTEGEAKESTEKETDDTVLSPLAAYQPLSQLRAGHKLHSFAFMPGSVAAAERSLMKGGNKRAAPRPAAVRLLVAQRNNQMAVWECELKPRGATEEVAVLASAGHRQEPRCVALSGDERSVLSVGDGEAKVWSISSQQCLRTLPCGYGLTAVFVLSSQFVLVGTKSGALMLFSMATGDLVHEVQAHKGAVLSLALAPGNTAVLSASADKTLATWIPTPQTDGTAELQPDRTHELTDDALCAHFSPDGKYIAVGLLDASVKVLFFDTFKLFLTLFGHKLPVLSLSISSDGTLLVSGSADKSVKIWGLDFGDCHRSLYAHTESVTAVSFVRGTHYFVSAGKDKLIKFWDADTFEHVMTMRAHTMEVWGIAVSRNGGFFVSTSRDRSIRLWRRTDEQVFIEEERDAELEAVFEGGVEKQQQTAEAEEEEALALGIEGGGAESTNAGRRTLESVKGAERVLEALRVLEEDDDRQAEFEAALKRWEESAASASDKSLMPKQPVLVPNLLLLNLTPGAYLLKALSSVRPAELDQALMLLPFEAAQKLLTRLLPLIDSAPPIELMSRCILFLLKVHHKQIVANRSLLTLLHPLDAKLRRRVARERDMLGFNIAALSFAKNVVEERSENGKAFFDAPLAARASREAATTAELRRKTAAREPKRIKKK